MASNDSGTEMERNDGVRSLLLKASVYQRAQRLIGAEKSCRRLASAVIRSTPESSIVDIGCGTADIADYLEFGSYTGFDPNPPYIEGASQRLGGRADLFVAGVGDETLNDRLPDSCDIVLMMGVLHHLDDELASGALALGARLIGAKGRFISFDPGFVEGQPKIARALIRRDRGQHVRTVESTTALLEQHFDHVSVEVHHDFLSVPYTHLVVTATQSRG